MSSSELNREETAESHARYIGSAVLFINTDGSWSVGQVGQKISQYQPVKVGGKAGINDDSYEFTAVAAEKADGGGYLLYIRSNDDDNTIGELRLDASGNYLSHKFLSDDEMYVVEDKYGIDLNDNGGFGDDELLQDDGDADVYQDAKGAYQIRKDDGSYAPISFGATKITKSTIGSYAIKEVVRGSAGNYDVYITDKNNNVVAASLDTAGNIQPSSLRALTSEQVAQKELETGKDLNGVADTPVTAGWTSQLKTSAIRTAVEAKTLNGAKIDHAGLVAIVDAALASLTGATTVGADVVADLRAIAARAKALFTAKNLAGSETGYLQYVFDKMVNGSKANAFYTGGTTKTSVLGDLSDSTSPDTLQKLENKWLLGKDLPNPTTEGDTANPNAAAATGIYKAFDAQLIVGGASIADVNQGSAGTCYLLASEAVVAASSPTELNNVFVSNGKLASGLSTWGVRFFDTAGKEHWVTADNELVVNAAGDDEATYAKVKGTDANGKAIAELWAPLIEKAYAQANELKIFARTTEVNSMFAIEGGLADPVVSLVGGKVTTFADAVIVYNGNPILQTSVAPPGSTVLAEIAKAINSGKAVWIASANKTTDAAGNTLFTSGHAYMAYDADPANPNNTTIRIFNPWGVKSATDSAGYVAPFDGDLVSLVGVDGYDFWVQA